MSTADCAAAIDYRGQVLSQTALPRTARSRKPRRQRPGRPPLPRIARTHAVLVTALLAAPLAALIPSPARPSSSLFAATSFRFNLSGSLPPGLYRLEPLLHPPRPGDLVLACPPPAAAALARRRGYLDAGSCPGGTHPLGKLVLATAGDRVDLTAAAVTLNRCRLPASASLPLDRRGRPLPHPPTGTYLLRAGELWLFAPHPRSFDSRYFGPVTASEVRGLLHPLLIQPSPRLRRWTALLRACGARR